MSELDPPATKSGGPGVAGLFAQGAASIRTVRGRRHHLGHAPLACTTTLAMHHCAMQHHLGHVPLACTTTLAMKHCAMQHHLCHAPPLMTCTTLRCTTTYAMHHCAMHHCAMHHHSGRAQKGAREYNASTTVHATRAHIMLPSPLYYPCTPAGAAWRRAAGALSGGRLSVALLGARPLSNPGRAWGAGMALQRVRARVRARCKVRVRARTIGPRLSEPGPTWLVTSVASEG